MPVSHPLPDLNTLRSKWNYNPETGEFTDKKGKVVGCSSGNYVRLSFGRGRQLKAHRVAWYMHTGQDPLDRHIDHINRNAFDNRICNLRPVSQLQNQWNARPETKGYKEVRGRYYVRFRHNYKNLFFGGYDTPEEAHAVYLQKRNELRGDYVPAE